MKIRFKMKIWQFVFSLLMILIIILTFKEGDAYAGMWQGVCLIWVWINWSTENKVRFWRDAHFEYMEMVDEYITKDRASIEELKTKAEELEKLGSELKAKK